MTWRSRHKRFFIFQCMQSKRSQVQQQKSGPYFDASAKSSTGVSLYDTLLVGLTIHPPIVDVLFRFHLHSVALIADPIITHCWQRETRIHHSILTQVKAGLNSRPLVSLVPYNDGIYRNSNSWVHSRRKTTRSITWLFIFVPFPVSHLLMASMPGTCL